MPNKTSIIAGYLKAGLILLLASSYLTTSTSFAAMLSPGSELLMGGGAITLTGSASTIDLSNAEGIDFANNSGLLATFGGGDFNNIDTPKYGSIADLSFNTAGIDNFIAVEGWVFNLESVTVSTQTSDLLVLLGTGTVSGNAFDATAANWVFSTHTTGSYSTAISTVVPVPAAVWLFGSGLIGLASIARRKNKRA